MPSLRTMSMSAAAWLAVVPNLAWGAGDRAAFEQSVAELAPGLGRPNPIAFLVGVGDWYCGLKAQHGGGVLDIQDAAAAFRRSHPDAMRSADETMVVDAALAEAAKLLCPN